MSSTSSANEPPSSSFEVVDKTIKAVHHGRQASLPSSMPLPGNNHVHFQAANLRPHHHHHHRGGTGGQSRQQLSDIQNHSSLDTMDLYNNVATTASLNNRLPPLTHRASMQQQQPHELKRPDSVITTSSIVSSDTNSQAGDSSTEASGPPSAYAISGLYGSLHNKKVVSRRRTHSGSLGLGTNDSAVTNNPGIITNVEASAASTVSALGEHSLLSKSNSCAPNPGGNDSSSKGAASVIKSKTHRRQTSHPANAMAPGGASQNPASAAAELIVSSMLENTTAMHKLKGHRRSHSYGHHKGFHDSSSASAATANHRHRRTGSSVIETLQTLACTGAEQDNPNDSIAQFLENLRKEQAEKNEKREMQEMQDELEDLRDCGLGNCKPAFLQSCANIKVFVFLLSLLMTLQQALTSGYLNSVITTIEKRYEIPSSISGIIASMYEIGNVITVIFVSYLGSRRHIPVWIGMGILVMGIGSITFSLPHFLTGPHMVAGTDGNTTSDNICRAPRLLDQADRDAILKNLPGLDKIKNLAEGLSNPPLAPHNNQYNREDNCIEQANKSAALPIFVFMVAQLLLGCGGSPLFTLGTTYIDNHVKRDSSSMYIGFMYSMCAFGPVCGFLLGAYLLSHHVDTFSLDVSQLNLDSTDRHWVGMWWGGFLICGGSLLLIAIPFFFFPKELKKEKVKVYIDEKYHHATDPSIRPKADHKQVMASSENVAIEATANNEAPLSAPSSSVQQPTQQQQQPPQQPASKASTLVRKDSQRQNNEDANKDEDTYGKDIKDIPRSTWKLLTNKIYLVTCLGACMELIIVSGFIVFLPKYLETQFNLSKSMASMFTGGIAIPGACIGIFFGGYILKRLQLRPKGAVQLVIFFNILCLSCYAMLFFFGCENIKMAGTTMPYSNSNSTEPFQINLTASCNFGCECDMNDVQPVCGANGLTYFSPCHAGCTSLGANSDNYTNCACVLNAMQQPSPLVSQGASGSSSAAAGGYAEVTMIPVATAGPCYKQCKMILPFMVLLFFMTLLVAVTQMPVLMVVLRSVAEEEKAFALGIQFVIFRLFGYIPSPILFGSVIDSTCLLWKSTCAGEAGGRCLMYDIEAFRFKYVGVCCGIKVLSVLTFLLDWYLIKRRESSEKKQTAMTVGEVVNSIISLDKLFEPDGPMWVKMVDPEADVREEDEEDDEIEVAPPPTAAAAAQNEDNEEVVLQDGQRIVVSHPRRKNHRINMKRSPPMTPSKASAENSSCLVERPR